jgi:hypothetical protein
VGKSSTVNEAKKGPGNSPAQGAWQIKFNGAVQVLITQKTSTKKELASERGRSRKYVEKNPNSAAFENGLA